MTAVLPLSPFIADQNENRFVLDEEAFLADIEPMPIFLDNPSGRTVTHISKDEALHRFWRAARDAGIDPVEATERMGAFAATYLDPYERDLEVIRQCIGRKI